MVEDEGDGGGEEDGDKADRETEDPIIGDTDVHVEGGEQGAPQNHIQHLREQKESFSMFLRLSFKYKPTGKSRNGKEEAGNNRNCENLHSHFKCSYTSFELAF